MRITPILLHQQGLDTYLNIQDNTSAKNHALYSISMTGGFNPKRQSQIADGLTEKLYNQAKSLVAKAKTFFRGISSEEVRIDLSQ